MRYYPFYIAIFLICVFGCNSKPDQKLDEINVVSDDITAKDIESLRFDDYALSEDSSKALENWNQYNELIEQTDFLKKADFSFFNDDKKVMKTFITEFKTGMPEVLKSAPILSRTTALETKLLKLNSILKLDNMDKETHLNAIKEYLVSLSNFNLQVNKKFELDANLVDKSDNIE